MNTTSVQNHEKHTLNLFVSDWNSVIISEKISKQGVAFSRKNKKELFSESKSFKCEITYLGKYQFMVFSKLLNGRYELDSYQKKQFNGINILRRVEEYASRTLQHLQEMDLDELKVVAYA